MNAAILAARMLAVSDPELLDRLKAYTAEMKATVQGKDAKSLQNPTIEGIYGTEIELFSTLARTRFPRRMDGRG